VDGSLQVSDLVGQSVVKHVCMHNAYVCMYNMHVCMYLFVYV